MSLDLVVPASITESLQSVTAQDGSTSGLALASNATVITGQDVAGGAMPLAVLAQATQQPTWNRILRLASGSANFFDFGIDTNGNFFINSNTSTETVHVLTISPGGQVTIPNLVLTNLQTAPSGSTDLAVDSNGMVYKQS